MDFSSRSDSDVQLVEFYKVCEDIDYSAEKLSTKSAVLILLSIAFGVGYTSLPEFFFNNSELWYVPVATVLAFFVNGLVACYLLIDLKHHTNLNSF